MFHWRLEQDQLVQEDAKSPEVNPKIVSFINMTIPDFYTI